VGAFFVVLAGGACACPQVEIANPSSAVNPDSAAFLSKFFIAVSPRLSTN
jgi:hypothetical protein